MVCLAVIVLFASLSSVSHAAEKYRVYVGTYTGPKCKGVYLLELDVASGAVVNKGVAGEVTNPSFLAIHPSHKYLYAVSEVSDFSGKPTGAVSAFSIEGKSGMLTALNHESSQGAGPCHLVVDKTGKNVLAANYGGGSICSLPIGEDGKLGPATSAIKHQGKRTHAHSINLDAANRFAFVADLGLDKVLVYKFDAAKGLLTPNDPPGASVAEGQGPRHFAFHPSGKFAYVINEQGNTVTAFTYNADKGVLTDVQNITTLPKEFEGKSYTAEIVVHPSGKFVYGSNRGHDSLAIYAIDEATGKLTAAGHTPTGGKTPRNFNIDPTGAYLFAENQGSDSIVVFKIDPQTGALKATGTTIDVPSPVCVKFLAVE